MNLKDHAEQEVVLAGLLDDDADYGGMIGRSVIELAALLGAQGHSGFSAMVTLDVFNKVARYENLTPLTSDPAEWIDQSDKSGTPIWQNTRNPAAFSTDGGTTWYTLEEEAATA